MKYVRVVEWSVEDGSIHLQMLGEDDQIHHIEVGVECAGALVSGLSAELEKLKVPAGEQQFIRPTGMQTGKTEQGEPLLFMKLAGGVELPLVFKRESLGVLISELEKLRQILQPEGQIRWS